MSKDDDKALADIDAELARRGVSPQSDAVSQIDAELARRRGSTPPPATAGMLKFGTTLAGAPVDAIQNAINLGIAGANVAYRALPSYPLVQQGEPTPLLHGSVGGSESLQSGLRATGVPLLSPDNPTPNSKMGSTAYDLSARGGFVPGGFLPAVSSIVAEKTLGPQWAGPASMVPAAVGQVVRSRPLSPEAQILKDEGVQLTPGQTYGGVVKRIEDAATSVPVLGDAIKGAQRRGMEQYTVAAINRSLRSIGEELPKGLTGNKAIDYAYGKFGEKYDDLLPNLRGDLNAKPVPAQSNTASSGSQVAPFNPVTGQPAAPGSGLSFREELDNLRNLGQNLPEPQRGQLGRIIDKEIIGRFTPQGMADGQTLKDIESKLGGLKKDFRKSDNYDVRSLGDAVDEMQSGLRRMIERVNPEYSGELAKINEGYSKFKISQRAASSVGAQDGVFSPAQLHTAVKAQDQSKDKARFAEGNANMQDLSSAGKKVLPSTVPDSGTPFRAALLYALANPGKAAALAGPVGATAAAYTPLGQHVIARMAASRGVSPEQLLAQEIVSEQQANGPTLEKYFNR